MIRRVEPFVEEQEEKRTGSRGTRFADWPIVGFLLAVIAVCCMSQSLQKPFWYDELVTMRIAALPTLGAIYRFHESGTDTTSFLPAMLVHGLRGLRGMPEFNVRIPFTAAYLVACYCIWVFVRRKYAAGFAAAAMLLLAQGETLFYASEARAYAFALMGTALAMVAWQAANREGRFRGLATVGVFAGLATAILFHFFAIFLFVPFAFAEWVRQRETGRTRWGMWLALVLFPASLAVMLPGLVRAKGLYGNTFWSKPVFVDVTNTYVVMLTPIARDFSVLLLIVAISLWWRSRRGAGAREATEEAGGFTRSEWVLLVGVSLIPLIAFVGSKIALGVYQPRYVLYFQAGGAALLTGGLAELLRRRVRAGWVLGAAMLILLVIHVRAYVTGARDVLAGAPISNYATEYKEAWYDVIRDSPLPVVADGPLVFLPVEYYGPPELKDRLLLLTSSVHSVEQPKSVTTDLNMRVFGRQLGYRVEDYDEFAATHKDFFVVVGTEYLDYVWLSHFLIAQSASKRDVQITLLWSNVLVKTNAVQIYRVHLGTEAPAPR